MPMPSTTAAAGGVDRNGINETYSRPPFAYMFRYLGSTYGPQEWEDIAPLDTYLSKQAAGELGIPHKKTIRYFKRTTSASSPRNRSRTQIRPIPWNG